MFRKGILCRERRFLLKIPCISVFFVVQKSHEKKIFAKKINPTVSVVLRAGTQIPCTIKHYFYRIGIK